jgi:hypothetical protein
MARCVGTAECPILCAEQDQLYPTGFSGVSQGGEPTHKRHHNDDADGAHKRLRAGADGHAAAAPQLGWQPAAAVAAAESHAAAGWLGPPLSGDAAWPSAGGGLSTSGSTAWRNANESLSAFSTVPSAAGGATWPGASGGLSALDGASWPSAGGGLSTSGSPAWSTAGGFPPAEGHSTQLQAAPVLLGWRPGSAAAPAPAATGDPDDQSYVCPRCRGVVALGRRAQHDAYWCDAAPGAPGGCTDGWEGG